MALPGIEEIIRTTTRSLDIPATDAQVAEMAERARKGGGDGRETTFRILETGIASLQREALDALIKDRARELADLRRRRKAMR